MAQNKKFAVANDSAIPRRTSSEKERVKTFQRCYRNSPITTIGPSVQSIVNKMSGSKLRAKFLHYTLLCEEMSIGELRGFTEVEKDKLWTTRKSMRDEINRRYDVLNHSADLVEIARIRLLERS